MPSGDVQLVAKHLAEKIARHVTEKSTARLERCMVQVADKLGLEIPEEILPSAVFDRSSGEGSAAEEAVDVELAAAPAGDVAPPPAPLEELGGSEPAPEPPQEEGGDGGRGRRKRRVTPRGAAEEAAEQAATALPPGWRVAQNANGREYYYNEEGATSWKPPTAAAAATELPGGWREVEDAKGRRYFYHRETRMSTWQRPAPDA